MIEKSQKQKKIHIYRETEIRMTADFSSENSKPEDSETVSLKF